MNTLKSARWADAVPAHPPSLFQWWRAMLCCSCLLVGTGAPAAGADRAIPRPLAGNPGNVFVAGQPITVPIADQAEGEWRLVDYDERRVATVVVTNQRVALGALEPGWYRLRSAVESNRWISLAVLAPLSAPTPEASPISIDVAMSWFYPAPKMAAAANLCALAGVNWVRDRLSWAEMEPRRGTFAGSNRYDASAQMQSAAGLRVLQVNHISPRWANPNAKRFPTDLRDVYQFYRAMASRWDGQVLAFEPWNEADIIEFGGHTGAEMASLQKAAYLGLKAGNSNVIACLNVWAKHRRSQLEDFADNDATGYFDTFNLHHYEAVERYPELYADFRRVSAGKPLWVTEFAVPVKWTGDEKLKEPGDADLRAQSERLLRAFAASLFEGSENSFYFLLPHYVEGQTQFGILRADLTPRPAYVALSAVGRFLATARPLGRLPDTAGMAGYVFRSQVDGVERDILIAWTTGGTAALPPAFLAAYDHLGRRRTSGLISSQPMFAIYAAGAGEKFNLIKPPQPPELRPASASTVVFQALTDADKVVLTKSAGRVSSERAEQLKVFAYNFGPHMASGQLKITAPNGWRVEAPSSLRIEPKSRVPVPLQIDCRAARSRLVEKLTLVGDFIEAGRATLSLRLMPEPNQLSARESWPLSSAARAAAWKPTISGGGQVELLDASNGVLCAAQPGGNDRWVFPVTSIPAAHRIPVRAQAVRFTFTLLEGEGTFRALFDEENGSGYVIDWMQQPKRGETMTAIALFEDAVFGHGWAKPDANHRFDPAEAVVLKIGCNTKSDRVRFVIGDVRWVAF